MDKQAAEATNFSLFDSAGIGAALLDGDGVFRDSNHSFLRYLESDADSVLGKALAATEVARSWGEFHKALTAPGSFRCLVPGRTNLLLTTCRGVSSPSARGDARVVILRPYSLEREFIRMRSRLNRNVVTEISEHLSSIAVAGEIILQPELQEEEGTRSRFLASFLTDISDLSHLFHELQEISEPIPFPARIRPAPLDWRGMTADLLAKMKGLANERNVHLESDLPSRLPAVQGDHQWLLLALYGVLNHAVMESPPLGVVRLDVRPGDGRLETAVSYDPAEETEAVEWPPATLFPLPEDGPQGGKLGLTDLALSRSIFLLHGGGVERTARDGAATFLVHLPA